MTLNDIKSTGRVMEFGKPEPTHHINKVESEGKTKEKKYREPAASGIQPYGSLDELVRFGKLILPKPRKEWRLVKDPLCGHINGLETFNGSTIATNGIMVLLQDELGCFSFGHLQWFVPNTDEKDPELSDLWDEVKVATTKKPKVSLEQKLKHVIDYI